MTENELKIIGAAIAAVMLGGQWVLGRRSKTIENQNTDQTQILHRTLTSVVDLGGDLRRLDGKVDAHHAASQGELQAVRVIAEKALGEASANTRRLDLIETRRGDVAMTRTPPGGVVVPPIPSEDKERSA